MIEAFKAPQDILGSGVITSSMFAQNRVINLGKGTTDVEVVNSATETNIAEITVPGGTLGTNKVIVFRGSLSHYNNSGSAVNFTLRAKYGATSLGGIGFSSLGATTARRLGQFELRIKPRDADTQKQAFNIVANISTSLGANENIVCAENSSNSLVLAITGQHSVADANVSIIVRDFTVMLFD